MSRFKFFEEEQVNIVDDHKTKLNKKAEPKISEPVLLKYRCEQTVATKLNNVITNHATTKREFHIKNIIDNGSLIVEVSLVDNIIKINPTHLSEAMDLFSSLDLIKCNVKVLVDQETGKIKKILNYSEVLNSWENFKALLKERYSFLRSSGAEIELKKFIYLAEAQIKDEKILIEDIHTKLFFDLFFDRYLVNLSEVYKPFTLGYNSQLFEGISVPLHISSEIVFEKPLFVELKKQSKIDVNEVDISTIKKKYDQKFQPIVGYKFSSYDFQYQVRQIINTELSLIEETDVFIMEEVKNNVEVIVDYKLRRIE
ncbi:hypothetical protein [Pedobacter jejuensis]|uniref:Uncharacterized protein n=1 Tax=Pedobacter jejuensis TaxID=1268550 RepID=A0A3N0C0X0_9SPHI|nr:hypothetical protein [Pedobacter jejuensis]RNL55855.1 hypothetical protein D7004_03635 [Pedobacter jejuensis]